MKEAFLTTDTSQVEIGVNHTSKHLLGCLLPHVGDCFAPHLSGKLMMAVSHCTYRVSKKKVSLVKLAIMEVLLCPVGLETPLSDIFF